MGLAPGRPRVRRRSSRARARVAAPVSHVGARHRVDARRVRRDARRAGPASASAGRSADLRSPTRSCPAAASTRPSTRCSRSARRRRDPRRARPPLDVPEALDGASRRPSLPARAEPFGSRVRVAARRGAHGAELRRARGARALAVRRGAVVLLGGLTARALARALFAPFRSLAERRRVRADPVAALGGSRGRGRAWARSADADAARSPQGPRSRRARRAGRRRRRRGSFYLAGDRPSCARCSRRPRDPPPHDGPQPSARDGTRHRARARLAARRPPRRPPAQPQRHFVTVRCRGPEPHDRPDQTPEPCASASSDHLGARIRRADRDDFRRRHHEAEEERPSSSRWTGPRGSRSRAGRPSRRRAGSSFFVVQRPRPRPRRLREARRDHRALRSPLTGAGVMSGERETHGRRSIAALESEVKRFREGVDRLAASARPGHRGPGSRDRQRALRAARGRPRAARGRARVSARRCSCARSRTRST